jgi:hypothetical protein
MLPARSPTVSISTIRPGHRHGLSRRQLLTGAGVGAAGLVGAQVAGAASAFAAKSAGSPRPIPGGIQPFGPGTEVFHVFFPGTGEDSTIFDFNGFVGASETQGVGTGEHSDLTFDVDSRFMTGEFVAVDGRHFNATFGFL